MPDKSQFCLSRSAAPLRVRGKTQHPVGPRARLERERSIGVTQFSFPRSAWECPGGGRPADALRPVWSCGSSVDAPTRDAERRRPTPTAGAWERGEDCGPPWYGCRKERALYTTERVPSDFEPRGSSHDRRCLAFGSKRCWRSHRSLRKRRSRSSSCSSVTTGTTALPTAFANFNPSSPSAASTWSTPTGMDVLNAKTPSANYKDGLMIYANTVERITPNRRQLLLELRRLGHEIYSLHCASFCSFNLASRATSILVGRSVQEPQTL